jgi:hypothetical protein
LKNNHSDKTIHFSGKRKEKEFSLPLETSSDRKPAERGDPERAWALLVTTPLPSSERSQGLLVPKPKSR